MAALEDARAVAALVAGVLLLAATPAGASEEARPAESNVTPWMVAPEMPERTPWGLLDTHRSQGGTAPSWTTARSLTGDWGGRRSTLAREYGLAIVGDYTAEVAGNPVGGRRQNVRYTHNVGLAVLADLETLVGLEETYFMVSASNRAGESNSARDIGNVFAVQQLFGGQTTRLVDLALGKRLLGGALDLVAGRINGLDDFIASPLYCNAQNLALCGNPLGVPTDVSISSYPNTAWGARARYQFHPAAYVMGGAYNTFGNFRDNKYHGVDFSIRDDSGVLGIGEVGIMPHRFARAARLTDLPGHYKVGGYYDTEPLTVFRTGAMEGGTQGAYLGFDQMVYREGETRSVQGLTPFVTFHWAPSDKNTLVRWVSWGAVYEGLIPGRDADVLGFFGAWGRFSDDLRASQVDAGQPGQDYEIILELSYRVDVLPWFYLQPDVQGVLNPGATDTIPNALVLALQFGVPF